MRMDHALPVSYTYCHPAASAAEHKRDLNLGTGQPLGATSGDSVYQGGREPVRATFYHAYFLPWLGYFAKLEISDVLVILDRAKFRRNHIKRVKVIGTQGNPEWLTIPVGNNWSVPCNEIKLPAEESYLDKILRTLALSYHRAQEFEREYQKLKLILQEI